MTNLVAIKDGVKVAYGDAIAKAEWERSEKLDALFDLFQFKGEQDDFDAVELMAIRDELFALGDGVDDDNRELDAEAVGLAIEALDRVLGTTIHE